MPPAERARRSALAGQPARAHGDHSGHRSSSGDTAVTRWAGGCQLRGHQGRGGVGGWIRSKGERRRVPSPYLEQVEDSPRNPIGGTVAVQQDAYATLGASRPRLDAVSPPGTERLRRENAGARLPRRPLRDAPRLRPAPPSPAGLCPRVRGSEGSRHCSLKEGPEVPLGGRGNRVEVLGSAAAGCGVGEGVR